MVTCYHTLSKCLRSWKRKSTFGLMNNANLCIKMIGAGRLPIKVFSYVKKLSGWRNMVSSMKWYWTYRNYTAIGIIEADTQSILHFQNDFNGQVQTEHGDKFTTGFVVQPAHIDQALKEIERCVTQLNMKLLCLSTHYLTCDGHWVSVADDSCEPIW